MKLKQLIESNSIGQDAAGAKFLKYLTNDIQDMLDDYYEDEMHQFEYVSIMSLDDSYEIVIEATLFDQGFKNEIRKNIFTFDLPIKLKITEDKKIK